MRSVFRRIRSAPVDAPACFGRRMVTRRRPGLGVALANDFSVATAVVTIDAFACCSTRFGACSVNNIAQGVGKDRGELSNIGS